MFGIFEGLLSELGKHVVEGLNQLMLFQFNFIFFAEKYVPVPGMLAFFQGAMKVSSLFSISLLVLLFLKKGFDTYVLWTAGDADQDTVSLLVRFITAIATISLFPILYEFLARETSQLALRFVEQLSNEGEATLRLVVPEIAGKEGGFVSWCLYFVAVIMFVLLFFQFFKKGLEMIVLRIGLPLAACGLIASDGGVFPAYLQMFTKSAITILIQLVLFRIFVLFLSYGADDLHALIWAIACLGLSLKTPQLVQQFVVPTARGGGGGVMSGLTRLAMLLRRR